MEKPLSDLELGLIVQSMEGLSELGPKEGRPHVRQAYLEYFDQLKKLVIEYKKYE
jgi:hypothetical protein